jgi:Domain of Unknown Function (DUF928)
MQSLFSRSIALALTASLWLSLAQSAQSGPRPRFKVVLPPVPKTAPIARTSGASRGCNSDRISSAIGQKWMSQGIVTTWAMTSQTQPTIWAELPFAGSQIEKLRLVIYDSQNPNRVLQLKPIASPNQPGLIAVQVPKPLLAPQTYRWTLTGFIRCDNGSTPSPMKDLAGGWIEYKPAIGDLQTQLTQAEPIDQASLYASNGYWLDALTILGRNRMSGDQSWSLLLRGVGQANRLAMPIEFR